MMTQFAFEEPAFERPRGDVPTAPAGRQLAHAAEVMADLAGVTEDSLNSLPQELPVEAAVACGNCRLYRGAAPQVVFPTWLATAAARRLVALLDQATADAERLPELWDDATGEEAEDLVAGLLHARMDAWAATLQLDEVLDHTADDVARPALEAAIDDFDAALERFDRALDARRDFLCTLTGTRLLENFRHMLVAAHRDPLPWWLDGRLEAEAAAIDARTDDLIAETLFTRRDARSAPTPLTFAQLRAATSQTYAAAASTAALPVAGPWLRWQSPDRRFVAELVPPVARQATPESVVIDFTIATGVPALDLVGQRCLLAGVETAIGRRAIDGSDRAVASFPGAAVLGSGTADDQPIALVVGTDPVAWTFVTPR